MYRLLLPLCFLAFSSAFAEPAAYQSPYKVVFTFPEKELAGDFDGQRGDWKNESSINFRQWNSPEVQKRYGSWGPPAQHFSAPPGAAQKSPEWLRQRVIAAGLRFRGYPYQHHHIPDWEPGGDARPGPTPTKGLDCSNFTAFAYNLALGLKPSGGIKEQPAMIEVEGPGPGRKTRVQRIEEPADHATYPQLLKTGDLLFIRGKVGGEITHVVLWVGDIGQSQNKIPLILDSTGEGRKDENGVEIPNGVQLRPFSDTSWYHRCATHAIRIIPDK